MTALDSPEASPRSVAATLNATIIVVGTMIVAASRAAVVMVRASDATDLVGHALFDFVATPSIDAARQRNLNANAGRSLRPEQIMLRCVDGTEVLADIASTRVTWDGEMATQVTVWEVPDGTDNPLQDPIVEQMRRGIDRGEFVVHYQPIVRLRTGTVIGVEALVRWKHPERGLLPPIAFIGVAESSGLIVDLGEAVVSDACRQAELWRGEGHDLQLSVNLSGRQLADPSLPGHIAEVMQRTSMPAGQLWLEMTETSVVNDLDQAAACLRHLHGLGARVSIDDFGTGWNSLTALQNFPVDELKIDRRFVDGIGVRPEDTAIVQSIVSLGRELGLAVVAEGIETEQQRETLLAIGCETGQGFLFGRPQLAELLSLR